MLEIGDWIYSNGGIPLQIEAITEKVGKKIFIGTDIYGSKKVVMSVVYEPKKIENIGEWKEVKK